MTQALDKSLMPTVTLPYEQAFEPFVLEVDNLACQRGALRLFDKLSIRLSNAQALWLRGANGIGKSSLLRLLAQLDAPHAGTARLGNAKGHDLSACEACHYVSHKSALSHGLSLRRNLQLWAQIYGSKPAALEAAIDRFALSNFLSVDTAYLSSGQTRRATLARLCLEPRPLWLLDEPFVGLDHESIALVLQSLDAHLNAGGAAIIVSHQAFTLDQQLITELELADYQPSEQPESTVLVESWTL